MKLLLATIFTPALICANVSASTVMTISGVIETTSVNAPVAVGSPFFIQLTWDTLTLENLPRNLAGPAWGEMLGLSNTVLDGSLFQGSSVNVLTQDAAIDSRAWFSLIDRLPGQSDYTFITTISFQAASSIFADNSHLPASFADWTLPAANFNWTFDHGATPLNPQGWSAGGSHYSSLTLVTIPEPGGFFYFALVSWLSFGARNRMHVRQDSLC